MNPNNTLKDHVIICGTGQTAFHIIEELEELKRRPSGDMESMGKKHAEYVVIDIEGEGVEQIKKKFGEVHYVIGDATDDDILRKANVPEAFGIFPVLPNEKDNLYVTIAARQMNPAIRIVSRTADPFNIGQKLFQAGANSVVSPNFIGGLRLVSEIARPRVTALLDQIMMRGGKGNIHITELVLGSSCPFCGKDLQVIRFPEKAGLMIIAIIKKGEKQYIYNPDPVTVLDAGDTIVVLGSNEQITGAGILLAG
jgi:voltage-gated potassium channel